MLLVGPLVKPAAALNVPTAASFATDWSGSKVNVTCEFAASNVLTAHALDGSNAAPAPTRTRPTHPCASIRRIASPFRSIDMDQVPKRFCSAAHNPKPNLGDALVSRVRRVCQDE